jgi:GxxExxY protein
MPICVSHPIEALEQKRFKEIASEVVGLSFDIHNEMGRLFEEHNYRKDLKRRLGLRAHDEVKIELSFQSFRTSRFIDLVVDPGGIFELKAVAQIADAHRAQLMNYLFLTGARHGKIINFRPESVEHEFVNATMPREQRTSFVVDDLRWQGSPDFRQQFESVMRDWGTGLSKSLYVEVAGSFLGGGWIKLKATSRWSVAERV